MGNADGSVIERLDYSSTGDFAGGGPGAGAFYHDADNDLDIDLRDFANFQVCFDPSGTQTTQACLDVHDFDTADASDGDIDLDDYARWFECSRGPFVTPDQACGMPMRAGAPPPSGTFGMHGRAFDVLSDGFVVQDFRARIYPPELGRWLQRDDLGFADGPNLYESFRSNPSRFVDPQGQQIQELINLFLTGRFLSNEEIELALLRGDVTLAQTHSRLLTDIGNAATALGDIQALVLVPQGFEEGFRQPAIEATTGRFEAFIFSQIEAGATLEEASSNVRLVALFGGDITGVTALGESVFGVELTTNEALTGSARVLRGVQGGSQIVIFVAGPEAIRQARERSAALRAVTAGVPSIAGSSAVRTRVLANIAESQAARMASRFSAFTARERALGAATAAIAPATTAIVPFFPPNRGFAGPTTQVRLVAGQRIDRFGGTAVSRFFSPVGTPVAARALPPGTSAQILRTFEVVRPFDVESGTVAPAFGQLGLGTQFRTPLTLQELLEQGFVREVVFGAQ